MAIRPRTLPVAVVPVVVGCAVVLASGGSLRALPAFLALAGAVLIQIGTNLANDVFDHEKGADRAVRLGPTRVTAAGLLTPLQVLRAMAGSFGLAAVLGLALAWIAGWPVIAIGALSIVAGIAYTAGPWPLGYHGLGDLFVFLFFGFVAVGGTVFVEIGRLPPLAVLAAIPVGAIATAVLVVNNVRDRETDAIAGKRTLAVRLGRPFGVLEYAALFAGAFAVPIALAALGAASGWVLLPLATAPEAVRLVRVLARSEGTELNRCLAATARLLLTFGALFAVGLVA
ncbi:MAG: 1,4-dihydroxy-2-naphthoate polyprenyltransferase [Deltaproteobacteria bacterium]|nr:1,4-dihydroxy-2-naphthoate polyprenyltransferase [Deltaproteobacteria bacterium]